MVVRLPRARIKAASGTLSHKSEVTTIRDAGNDSAPFSGLRSV